MSTARKIDTQDWPRCWKCQMPVEHLEAIDTGVSIIIFVRCHGESETSTIPDTIWDDMVSDRPEFGYAFGGPDEQTTDLD